jgi:ribosome-binding protein aMBF1 (putative translation factor)
MITKTPAANCNLENTRTQLAVLLEDLREKRANPFKGTVLEALTDEIRALRQEYGLSYREIAEKLMELKVDTDEAEVSDFCRRVLRPRGRKTRRGTPKPPPR